MVENAVLLVPAPKGVIETEAAEPLPIVQRLSSSTLSMDLFPRCCKLERHLVLIDIDSLVEFALSLTYPSSMGSHCRWVVAGVLVSSRGLPHHCASICQWEQQCSISRLLSLVGYTQIVRPNHMGSGARKDN
jgi:hypothetical protein